MASFNVIPYLGPPSKRPRSSNKPKATINNRQGGPPLQGTQEVCPGDDLNRSQVRCDSERFRTQTKDAPGSVVIVEPSNAADLYRKDDSDYSDWVCSSRSSTNSLEPLEPGKTLQVNQPENCQVSQISGTPRQRQSAIGVTSVKCEQQLKRKASMTELTYERGDQEQSSIEPAGSYFYDDANTVRQTVTPSSQQPIRKHLTRYKKGLDESRIVRHQERLYPKKGRKPTSCEDSSAGTCHEQSLSMLSSGRSPDQPILVQDGDTICSEFDRGDEWVVKQIKGHRSTTFGLEFKVAWEDTWVREEDLGTAWKLLRQYKAKPMESRIKRSRWVVKNC